MPGLRQPPESFHFFELVREVKTTARGNHRPSAGFRGDGLDA